MEMSQNMQLQLSSNSEIQKSLNFPIMGGGVNPNFDVVPNFSGFLENK